MSNSGRTAAERRFRAFLTCDRVIKILKIIKSSAMFCPNCGSPNMQITFKYCPSCGKENNQNKETNRDAQKSPVSNAAPASDSRPSTSSNNNNNTRTTSLQDFMTRKNEERTSYFKPSKKKRVSDKQAVTINIGLMEFNEEGLTSPLRGKSLPLKIPKDTDYKALLESAIQKRHDYDTAFDSERQYKLVYPDGQSAQTIPGCIQTFTVERYKNGLGKSYGRITLYLCPFFPLSNNDMKKEELNLSSDSSGEESKHDETPKIDEVRTIPGGGVFVDSFVANDRPAVAGGPSCTNRHPEIESGQFGEPSSVEFIEDSLFQEDPLFPEDPLFSEDPFSATDFL